MFKSIVILKTITSLIPYQSFALLNDMIINLDLLFDTKVHKNKEHKITEYIQFGHTIVLVRILLQW